MLNGSLEQDKVFQPGDKALVVVSHDGDTITNVTMSDHYRLSWELVMAIGFAIFLILFAGPTGVRAIASFVLTVLTLWKVLVPLYLKGYNPIWIGLAITLFLTVLIIALVYGFDRRCWAAVSGSFLGILVTCVLGVLFTDLFQIHGAVMSYSESLLYSGYQDLNLTQIFMASIFLGSSGEVVFSTDERRRQIISEAVRIVNHRVPVLIGIIDTETERMIEHGKVAQELGADALVATCPFYALQGMTEVEEHFRILHEELDLPIFAYDIPVCVHTKLPWKLLAKLGAEGVLAGVKDSSGDDISFRYLVQENEKNGHPMSILTGHEVVVDGAYLGGADGSVPGLANVEPEGYVRQWKAAQAGDWATVKAEQDRLNEISHIWDVTSGVQGYAGGVGAFKTAMNLMGIFDSPTMPRPVKAMTGENVEAIKKVLQDNGLL